MENKKIIILFILFVLTFSSATYYLFFKKKTDSSSCSLEAKECPDGSYVERIPPDCQFASCPGEKEGILIFLPQRDQKIKSPLKIEGKAKGNWFFEAQFSAELYDENGNFLGTTLLTAKDDWMKEDLVSFEGQIDFSLPSGDKGKLKFLSANPSGLVENQKIFEMPILFEKTEYRRVLLYYYNLQRDKDEKGNVKCSRDGLVAIERMVPLSKTPIQDTINLLLKGQENLKPSEIREGITTEYPLEGFKLKEVNLTPEGNLILVFLDPLHKTVGGACRTAILWSQIEKTAKQFPGVKKVSFLPEWLFQP